MPQHYVVLCKQLDRYEELALETSHESGSCDNGRTSFAVDWMPSLEVTFSIYGVVAASRDGKSLRFDGGMDVIANVEQRFKS